MFSHSYILELKCAADEEWAYFKIGINTDSSIAFIRMIERICVLNETTFYIDHKPSVDKRYTWSVTNSEIAKYFVKLMAIGGNYAITESTLEGVVEGEFEEMYDWAVAYLREDFLENPGSSIETSTKIATVAINTLREAMYGLMVKEIINIVVEEMKRFPEILTKFSMGMGTYFFQGPTYHASNWESANMEAFLDVVDEGCGFNIEIEFKKEENIFEIRDGKIQYTIENA